MKTVKFFLVAMVACAVCLTSCNDDNNNNQGNNGGNGNNGGGGAAAGKAKVTFGETAWDINWSDCGVIDIQGTQCLFVNAAPETPTSPFPMLYFMVTAETGRHMASTDPNLFMMYFYAKTFNLVDQNGNMVLQSAADYWAGNGPNAIGAANLEITALDVATLTVTIKGEGQFWNAMDYYSGKEPVSTMDYKIDANNFKLTPRAAKDMSPVAQYAMEQTTETIVM